MRRFFSHGSPFAQLGPIVIAAGNERRRRLRPLQDEAALRLRLRQADRLVEQVLVGDDAAGLDAAARREDDLRLGVVDPRRQLIGGEPAEHHRMHGADPRGSQHADGGFRHHRHVEDDDVAFFDAEVAQHGAEQLHFRQQAAVGEGLLGVGDGGIVDQRRLVVAAGCDVAVERVVAGVASAARKPAAVDASLGVEDFFGLLDPVDGLRRLAPETLAAIAEQEEFDQVRRKLEVDQPLRLMDCLERRGWISVQR